MAESPVDKCKRRWGRGGYSASDARIDESEVTATDRAISCSASGQIVGAETAAAPCSSSSMHANMPFAESAFDCFAVLDFEATCDDGVRFEPQEIIEFPLVLVDAANGAVVSEFRTYVQPVHHPQLTAFCTNLTGIQTETVAAAPVWSEALAEAQAWLDDQMLAGGFQRCVFVTCGDWDLKTMMPKQCALSGEHVPQRFRQWINVKAVFEEATGKKGGGMKAMLDALKLPLVGHHHSGLDDSRNIAKILQTLLSRGVTVDHALLSSRGEGHSRTNVSGRGRARRR